MKERDARGPVRWGRVPMGRGWEGCLEWEGEPKPESVERERANAHYGTGMVLDYRLKASVDKWLDEKSHRELTVLSWASDIQRFSLR